MRTTLGDAGYLNRTGARVDLGGWVTVERFLLDEADLRTAGLPEANFAGTNAAIGAIAAGPVPPPLSLRGPGGLEGGGGEGGRGEPQDLQDYVQTRGRDEEAHDAQREGEKRDPGLERGERGALLRKEELDLVQPQVDLGVLEDDLVDRGAAHPIPRRVDGGTDVINVTPEGGCRFD